LTPNSLGALFAILASISLFLLEVNFGSCAVDVPCTPPQAAHDVVHTPRSSDARSGSPTHPENGSTLHIQRDSNRQSHGNRRAEAR
jgi:hypothetical protein